MSREIKFRVWSVSEKRMYYPSNHEDNCHVSVFGALGRIPWGLYSSTDDHRIVTGDPDAIFNTTGVLMQFTGLRDKNGKEIYVGDLLFSHSITASQTPEEIEESGRWVVPVAFVEASFCYGPDGDPLEANECETDMEVIGNIYENPNHPDLLKYEQQALQ